MDYVEVTVGENTTKYVAESKNPICKKIVQNAQKQFDSDLAKITEIQTAPLSRE